jgi:hypothetical protein
VILAIVLIGASVFSLNGLGEDMSVFRMPFTGIGTNTEISFLLKPELTILNQGSDLRGILWTHPFQFKLTAPVGKGFAVGFGNLERFDQSFDVYYQEDALDIYLDGDGGIDELYGTVANVFPAGEIVIRGSYLFGNATEIWQYTMGGYQLVDTFDYSYRGRAVCIGLRVKFVSASFEIGDVTVEKPSVDTSFTVTLPQRVSLGLTPGIFGGQANLVLERAFWPEDRDHTDCTRVKLGFHRKRIGASYHFNPWYMGDITEHGVTFDYQIPLMRGAGSISLQLGCILRHKDDLNEFSISPGIHLTIRELFARRRK